MRSRFRPQMIWRLNLRRFAIPCSRSGGAERDRTVDPLLAKQVLSQLSYSPAVIPANNPQYTPCGLEIKVVGLGRFELPTSPLSGVRSNQLSYRPKSSLIAASPQPNAKSQELVSRKGFEDTVERA